MASKIKNVYATKDCRTNFYVVKLIIPRVDNDEDMIADVESYDDNYVYHYYRFIDLDESFEVSDLIKIASSTMLLTNHYPVNYRNWMYETLDHFSFHGVSPVNMDIDPDKNIRIFANHSLGVYVYEFNANELQKLMSKVYHEELSSKYGLMPESIIVKYY